MNKRQTPLSNTVSHVTLRIESIVWFRYYCLLYLLLLLLTMMTIMTTNHQVQAVLVRGALSRLSSSASDASSTTTTTTTTPRQNNTQTTTLKQRTQLLLWTRLHNNRLFPLLGIGVGNLQHELIPDIIDKAVHEYHVRLIDTAHASHNEHLIAQGLSFHSPKSLSNRDNNNIVQQTLNNKDDDNDNKDKDDDDDMNKIHIVTKVWYTYLGYERTKVSVQESLNALGLSSSLSSSTLTTTPTKQKKNNKNNKNNHLQLHMLIHWPRCRYDIPWMDCEKEEKELPNNIQQLPQSPPHLNPDDAFIDTWKILNEYYDHGILSSIGVSNFDLIDLQTIQYETNRIPHILQCNIWTILFDPDLVTYCQKHDIHLQVYNVMNGIFSQQSQNKAPNALHGLQRLAMSLEQQQKQEQDEKMEETKDSDTWNNTAAAGGGGGDDDSSIVTPPQIVLAWLMAQNISVIPRTSHHVAENVQASFLNLSSLWTNNINQQQVVMDCIHKYVKALLSGHDVDPPKATFVIVDKNDNKKNQNNKKKKNKESNDDDDDYNDSPSSDVVVVDLFWKHDQTGEEIPVKESLVPGEMFHSNTYPGHVFVATTTTTKKNDPNNHHHRRYRQEFRISADYDEHEHIHIEL